MNEHATRRSINKSAQEAAYVTSFPDWVPKDVVDFYSDLEKKKPIPGFTDILNEGDPFGDDYYDSHHYRKGLAALRQLMESPEMQKAWKVLDKRRSAASPKLLAVLLLTVLPSSLDAIGQWDNSRLSAQQALLNELERAIQKYKTRVGDDIPPSLSANISELQSIVDADEHYWHTDAGLYVKQKDALNPQRSYLVRRLGELFTSLYGTPLYATVASIAAVLLNDYSFDEDLVAKAIKSSPSSDC